MSQRTTAPLLASLQAAVAARATTPTNRNILPREPFTLDMDGLKAWITEQQKKPKGLPLTPKQMADYEEKSRKAGSALQ